MCFVFPNILQALDSIKIEEEAMSRRGSTGCHDDAATTSRRGSMWRCNDATYCWTCCLFRLPHKALKLSMEPRDDTSHRTNIALLRGLSALNEWYFKDFSHKKRPPLYAWFTSLGTWWHFQSIEPIAFSDTEAPTKLRDNTNWKIWLQ